MEGIERRQERVVTMPTKKDWFDEALRMYKPGEFGYRKIAEHFGLSVKTVESRFLRYKRKHNNIFPPNIDIADEIKTSIQKRTCLKDELCQRFKISEQQLINILNEIQNNGYVLMDYGDSVRIATDYIEKENEIHNDWNGDKIIRFGVVSDTHIGSIYTQMTILRKLYEIFEREGIDTVYHVGDLTEGYNMRRGHEYEVFLHGADAQCDYTVENYPRLKNGKTRFIIGNHDLSHMKSGGIDVGRRIAKERKDMEYLGALNAKVYLTPNCTMELNHPLDGACYALSYSIQKMIDSYSGGSKPNILLNGHHHKMFYLFYRNVHGVECGTTEAQSSWMKGKRIQAHIGGLIVTVHVHDDGTINRFIPEFIPFYDELRYDY